MNMNYYFSKYFEIKIFGEKKFILNFLLNKFSLEFLQNNFLPKFSGKNF